MAIETENFNPTSDIKLLCTCGHPKCDKRSIKQVYLNKVQLIRDDYGNPMQILSGGRCPFHPNEAKKSTIGDHEKCTTVDVRYKTTSERNKLMVLAGRHGATRVAEGAVNGVSFVHMAWTPINDRSVPTWQY